MTVMMTLTWKEGRPTLADAARELHVKPSDLDSDFGVQLIDPVAKEYTVLCVTDACHTQAGRRDGFQGPFSNPRIRTLAR